MKYYCTICNKLIYPYNKCEHDHYTFYGCGSFDADVIKISILNAEYAIHRHYTESANKTLIKIISFIKNKNEPVIKDYVFDSVLSFKNLSANEIISKIEMLLIFK